MNKIVWLFAIITVAGSPTVAQSFEDYPVQLWEGKVRLPDFQGEQSEFAHFRTRLSIAAKQKADFAGSWVVEQIGCGGGCTSTYLIDRKTGSIVRLPVGGEEQMYVSVDHRISSSLIKANWIANGWGPDGDCFQGQWNIRDFDIVAVGKPYKVDLSFCGF